MASTTKSHLTLVCLIAIGVAMHVPIVVPGRWDAVIYGACLLIAVGLGLRWAIHTALLMGLLAAISLTPTLRDSIGGMPVLPLLIPLLVSSLIAAAWSSTRQTLGWMRRGQVDANMWALIGLTGVVSAAALIAWAVWTDNLGIGERMIAGAAQIPLVALVFLGIPIFAFLNAITEEAIFRGVLLTALMESSKSPWLAIMVQASAFAALHYEMGFPNGLIGYAMVFSYGLVLGYLRRRTGGLMAPIVAHILADLVIGYILLFTQVKA